MNLLIYEVLSISRKKVELERKVNEVGTSEGIEIKLREIEGELVKLEFKIIEEVESLFEPFPEKWSERHFDLLLSWQEIRSRKSLKEVHLRKLKVEDLMQRLSSNYPWVKDFHVKFQDLNTDIYMYYDNNRYDLWPDEESRIMVEGIKKNAQQAKKVEGLNPISLYNLTTLVEETKRRLMKSFNRVDNLEKFLDELHQR